MARQGRSGKLIEFNAEVSQATSLLQRKESAEALSA